MSCFEYGAWPGLERRNETRMQSDVSGRFVESRFVERHFVESNIIDGEFLTKWKTI
jgi:hypothetical protein